MNSGNRLTTSMRMRAAILRSGETMRPGRCGQNRCLEVGIPVDRDHTGLEVHRGHVLRLHERDHAFALVIASHEDIVGAGGKQVRHGTERNTVDRDHFQAFQVDPVVLAFARWRQRRTRDINLGPAHRVDRVAIGDIGKSGDHMLAAFLAANACDLALVAPRVAQDPRLVAEDRAARLGPGLEFRLATNAEGACHPAQQDAAPGVFHREAAARRLNARPADQAAVAALAASLYSTATLSVSCAPLATQCLTRSTFSSTRFSAPWATGL